MNKRMQRAAVIIAFCFFSSMILAAQESNITAQKSDEPELNLELDLTDGSHLVGAPVIKAIAFQTPYAKLDIPLAKISTVTLASDHETVSVVMQNGDQLKGVLTTEQIEMECVFGRISIRAPQIERIQVIRKGNGLSESLLRGLVLHLAFDKDRGQKVVDSSPTGNDGQVYGATWKAAGKMGGAYEFDGQNDYIELGPTDLYQIQEQFSGCAWINRKSRTMIVLSNYRGGASYKGHFDFIADDGVGNYYVGLGQGADQMVRYSSTEKDIVPANEWHHVAFTYDERRGSGQRIKLYLDGNELSSYNIQGEGNSGPIMQTSDQMRIMANRASGFGKGMIHDVMLFNRCLSSQEIKKIYDNMGK
jgi:hypothetical protein